MTVLILLLPQKQKHLESFAGLDDGVGITAATEKKNIWRVLQVLMTVLILLLPQKQKHLESFVGLDDGVDITAATETKKSGEFCRS